MTPDELIAALEAAKEPDRELDAWIHGFHHWPKGQWEVVRLSDGDDWPPGSVIEFSWRVLRTTVEPHRVAYQVPTYTANVDDALKLLAPATLWHAGSMEEGAFARLVWPQPGGGYVGGAYEAKAATPAIALCIAARRARQR